jgi:murein DD-endopeptidase MepM/ murein hydrolase activator NlpD
LTRQAITGLLIAIAAFAAEARPRDAAVQLKVQPTTAKPGDLVLISVRAPEAPIGKLGDRPLVFYPHGKRFLALLGLPVETKPGPVEVVVQPQPRGEPLKAVVQVLDPQFPSKELKVANKFIETPPEVKQRIADDRAAFERAFDQKAGPPIFKKDFGWPRKDQITAPYGDLRTFNGKKQSQHYGLDIDGRIGDPIRAANEGEVVMVRDCYASGQTVLIHHGFELYTAYFHMSAFEPKLKEGQKVTKGQKLGKVGKTGRVTGPHLHWGVKVAGLWVNPESLLKLRFD